jgi:hypothetical protein
MLRMRSSYAGISDPSGQWHHVVAALLEEEEHGMRNAVIRDTGAYGLFVESWSCGGWWGAAFLFLFDGLPTAA